MDGFESRLKSADVGDRLARLKYFVRRQPEIAKHDFALGAEFPDIWTDIDTGKTYDMPLILMDYRWVEDANGIGHHGAILIRKHTTPQAVLFGMGDNYIESNVRQYLIEKYAKGCSQELQKVISTTMVKTIDGDGKTHETFDTWFLPSSEEMHIDIGNNIDMSKIAWSYFDNTPTGAFTPCKKRIFYDHLGVSRKCCLRSVRKVHKDNPFVYNLEEDGSRGLHSTSLSYHLVPACVIY